MTGLLKDQVCIMARKSHDEILTKQRRLHSCEVLASLDAGRLMFTENHVMAIIILPFQNS